MARKTEVPQMLEVEGARGGSYVRFSHSDTEEFIQIEVGHSCVRTVREDIPVTWLAAILTHAKDIGFVNAMGDHDQFPADYALMCNPAAKP